ncbi:MAG: NAD(P)H-hydrate epimerase, partial [bacterium]
MIPVATVKEMRAVDRILIEEIGIPSLTLMELAGKAVAEVVVQSLGNRKSCSVAIFCGRGNNGGDGL